VARRAAASIKRTLEDSTIRPHFHVVPLDGTAEVEAPDVDLSSIRAFARAAFHARSPRGGPMHRSLVPATLLLVAGCATQRPWTPVVDTYRDSHAQYLAQDMEECRELALQASGYAPQQGALGGVVGGLAGAAAGAAIGAALGHPAPGAAVGAAAGGIGTGVAAAGRSESEFKRAYSRCMRQRGHPVIN